MKRFQVIRKNKRAKPSGTSYYGAWGWEKRVRATWRRGKCEDRGKQGR